MGDRESPSIGRWCEVHDVLKRKMLSVELRFKGTIVGDGSSDEGGV